MSSLAQSCIGIKLLCFKSFFSISKFYLFMYMLYNISTPLFSRFFNVSIIIFDVMPVKIANTGSCILYNRPSDRVRLKNANYAIFSGQIVRLERPIMR